MKIINNQNKENIADISVIIPVFRCKECLEDLYERLKTTLCTILEEIQIIMIDDGCPDNSWETIKYLVQKDNRVLGIKLSRNFGQHNAITAGLDYSKGKWIVVMDCDLQDTPEEIIKLYEKTKDGYDIVLGQRIFRQDNIFKKYSSKFFYKVFKVLTGINQDSTVANFGIYSENVINSVKLHKEQNRFFPLLIQQVGFKKTAIPIYHSKSKRGSSAYTFSKLLNLAIDSIVANSNRLLIVFVGIGFSISILSVFYSFCIILKYFIYGILVKGWTSIIVAIFFMFGLFFSFFGILGLYIGKIFEETKARPLYIIEEIKSN